VFLSTIPLIDNLKSTRVSQNTNAIKSAFLSTQVEYLLGINSEHLAPAIDALVESGTLPMIQSISITGKAWVHFAIACIKLYVPNIAFDPAMKPMVERDRYLARKTEIKNKIEAEKLFELWFTGQDSNFSVQMLEKSLQELGDEPPHSLIARPQKSEMSSLQGDFSCLLQAVVDSKPHEKLLNAVLRKEEGFFSQETLFQTNLSRLIEKLQKGYPIYKDIVNPVVGFIYYLKLGLSLAVMGPEDSSPPDPKSFLWPYESPSDRSHLSVVANNDVQLLLLRQYAARSNTEGYEKLEKPARDNIHVIFQKLFRKWKQDVTQEKAKAAADSSLYHYRGEAPDFDQQDFKSMFPDYEDDDEGKDPAVVKEQSSKKSDHRGAAIKISQIHDVLFSSVRNEKLTTLVRDGASVFMKVLGGSQAIFSPKTIEGLLPAVLLSLKDTTEWVKGHKKTSKTYDFYTHENMEQAHKLVAIVKQIHKRMVYILEIWPENSTLQDAVEICQQLFEFPSETPVAKFITKVEKLHGILNEWQSVASSEFSVAEHINAVTQLIISWRRLELTTWPKLFDLEDEKARLNANSWWFFLYESIIANPLELLTEDLKNHVRQLISNLMSFMTTSSLGEFSHRLRLVRVFAEHLKRILIDYPDVDSLYGAVRNFVVYYSQYEAAVHETLGKQRKLMEKEVTNVVLLASWKDTNIVALHDSAKRSHHKLYKVVRKYRQALENSVASLLQAGMTTVDFKEKSLGLFSTEGHALKFDFENVKTVYETLVTTWDSRPPRFRDLEEGVKMMQRVTKLPKDRLDISACFERFYTSVVSTTKELQSETPSTMSEDVKGLVKHLKTRKRKAFTDALKELRKMGLKSNLSSALLRKQANLEGILAATAPLEERWRDVVDVSGMQYYFVRISETVLKIRDVKEPAPDLNAQEVARICGFMEHLLAITLEQRTSLFTSLLGFEILRADMARYKELADLGDGISTVLHGRKELAPGRFSDLERGFQRLPKILGFTLDLLAIHSEFSGESIQEVEVIVQEWKKRAIELNELFSAESRKIIHENIWQASTKALVDASEEVLAEIMVQAEVIVLRRPELQYAIQPSIQCTLTTAVMHTDDMTDAGHVSTSIKELNASLQDLADSIFVALQMLNETQRGYPTEADEVGWLLKYQSISTASIKALHMKAVSQKIKKVIVKASNLQPFDVQSSLAVRAAFAAYYPIVHEYGSICRRFIQTLALDHKSVCKTTYTLAMTASTLLTKGFCMPAEQSDEGGDGSGKLEAGTGLGDGDGAQDISKDIQADEDLSELAQEKNSEDSKEEIEDEEDAVDMGQDEMEGEMGGMEKKDDVDDEGEGDKEDREDEMDEETGDVDGLDPAAVDEKMWDEKGDDDDKEKEGENSDGKQSKGYDLDAKKDNKKQNDIGEQGEAERDGERSDDEGPAEKDDSVRQHDEAGGIDQHVPEVDTLDLPDDMELDGDEGSDEDLDENGDMNMDDLSDVVSENDGAIKDDGKGEDQEDKFPESDVPSVEPEAVDADENDEEMGVELGDGLPDQEPQELEKPDDSLLAQQPEDRAKEAEETAPSEVQGVQGGVDNQDTNDQAQSAQQETGEEVKADDAQQGQGTDQDQSLQQDQQVGQASAKDNDPSQEKNREEKPSEQESTFRKVGDILEKWHRQRKEILNANEEDPDRPQVDNMVRVTDMSFWNWKKTWTNKSTGD
jgi:midasin